MRASAKKNPGLSRPVIVPVRVPTPTPPLEQLSWEVSQIQSPAPPGMLQRSMSEASFSLLQQSMRLHNVTATLFENADDPRLCVLKQIGEMLDLGLLSEAEASEALALAMRTDETFLLMRSLFQSRRSVNARADFLRMWLQSQRVPQQAAFPGYPYQMSAYPPQFYGISPYPVQPPMYHHPASSFNDERGRMSQSTPFFPNATTSSPSPPNSTRSASPVAPVASSKQADLFFAPVRS